MKFNLHKSLILLRLKQHIIHEYAKNKSIKIIPHFAFGYEALVAALSKIFKRNDSLCLSHRNILYNIAFEKNIQNIIDELNLKKSGLNLGRIGSMNLHNPKSNLIYTSSILGNNLSVALGVAINSKFLKKKDSTTYVVIGDGALEEGSFYETLLLAKRFSVNIHIIIENNNYSMSSEILQRRSAINLQQLSKSLGVDFLNLEGNNVNNYAKTLYFLKKKQGPKVIEFKVKMFNNHHGVTPGWPSDNKIIDLNNGLIIKKDATDPAFLSLKYLKHKDLEMLRTFKKKYL